VHDMKFLKCQTSRSTLLVY